MKNFFLLILFSIFFFACHFNVDNSEKNKSIGINETISFRKFNWSNESILLNPTKIIKYDSYLIVCDKYEGKQISIIDIKKKKIVKRVVNVGRGPNELNDIFYMKRVGENMIQMGDLNLKKLLVFSLKTLIYSSTEIPEKVFNYKDFPLKHNEVLYRLYMLNDSLFTGLGVFNEGEQIIFKKNVKSKGINVEYKYNYPLENRKGYSDISNFQKHQIYKRRISISPNGKYIIYSSMSCFYYKIFEIKNNTIVEKFIRLDYLPEYEVINNMIKSKADKKWGFLNYPVATNEAAYLLEQTRLYSEYKYYACYTKRILRVGWDGEIKQIFKLDRDTQTIEVDEKNKRIWAITYNNETLSNELGYYEF